MSKTKNSHFESIEDLAPIIKIRTNKLKAEYYYDGSGSLEIPKIKESYLIWNDQIIIENGKITHQIEDLEDYIKDQSANIKKVKSALSILKREKKTKFKKSKKSNKR